MLEGFGSCLFLFYLQRGIFSIGLWVSKLLPNWFVRFFSQTRKGGQKQCQRVHICLFLEGGGGGNFEHCICLVQTYTEGERVKSCV